jgi:RNA polymerase sigma factor (sigma-70 family)
MKYHSAYIKAVKRHYAGDSDEEKFEKQCEDYAAELLQHGARFAASLGCNTDKASDLAQEALRRIFKTCWAKGRDIENPRSYIFVIISNMIKKPPGEKWWLIYESDKGEPESPLDLEHSEAVNPLLKPWEEIELKELRHQINNLPVHERHVLTLYFFEGLSYEEIANIFETTPHYIKKALSSAILTLQAAQKRSSAAPTTKCFQSRAQSAAGVEPK